MKNLYSSLAAILIATAAYAQTTYTWRGPNNGSWATATNWSPSRNSPDNDDILQFNDGTTKTITGVPNQSVGKLLISNNTNITLNASSNNRTLTMRSTSGYAFVIENGSTVTIGSGTNFILKVNNNAEAEISGRLVINSGRTYAINTAGTKTTVTSTGYIENSGTVNSTNDDRLSFLAGATYEHAQDDGTIPIAEWNVASNVNITGITDDGPSNLNQDFGNFTWDCPSQTDDINFSGQLRTVNGNLSFVNTNNRSVLLGNTSFITLNIGGNLTVGKTGNNVKLEMDSFLGIITINLGGNLVTLGNGQIDNAGLFNATLNFNRSSGTQYINLGNPSTFLNSWHGAINIGTSSTTNTVVLQSNLPLGSSYRTDITVSNGSTFDMGNFVISNNGTFTTNSGSTINIGNAAGISASGATGNIQVTDNRNYSAGATYAYTGTVPQVTGAGLPSTVSRLIINNSAGIGTGAGVTLSRSTAISTELVLTNGYLNSTASNIVTINNGATATATNNAFVAGPMRKTGSGSFTFPTGWAGINGGRIPITISSLSSNSTIQAEYKRMNSSVVGTNKTAPLTHVSACEYWELFPVSGSVNLTVTMNWNSYSNCSPVAYVDDFPSLVVSRSNGSTWTSVGNTGGSMGSGTVISNPNTTINNTFKYFSLGSLNSVTNPLPILLTDIKAFSKNNGVAIEWTNLTEKDIRNYIIQRSPNARDFTDIDTYLPKSNQGNRAEYAGFDAMPYSVSYYRVQAVEISGKIIYSKTVKVESGDIGKSLTIYPNPVVGREFTISVKGMQAGNYNLQLFNMAGQQVYYVAIKSQGNSLSRTIVLPESVSAGLYNLSVSGEGFRENRLTIIK